MSMSYAQMVEGCLRRDAKAQRALYDELAPMSMGVCMRYASSREEARDLLQDGFVKVFEKIGSLREPAKLRSWTYNIMVNTCIQSFRMRRNTLIIDDMDTYAEPDDIEGYSPEEVVAALQQLTERQRLVINLFYMEDYSSRQIAEHLSCSDSNVRALLTDARHAMRKKLEENDKR